MMFCCMAVVHFEVQKELKATDDVRSVLLTVILKANENTLSVSGCCWSKISNPPSKIDVIMFIALLIKSLMEADVN